MNTVEIDEQTLVAEAMGAVPSEPVQKPDAPVADQSQPVPESWAPVIAGIMPMLRIGVFPQWELQDGECEEFGAALAQCLDQVMPGGINGQYACWFRLIVAAGGIAATRYIVHGKLPPIGPKRKAVADDKADKTEAA